MSIEDFVTKMKKIQNDLLEFLEDESDAEGSYINLLKDICALKLNNSKDEFQSVMQLINQISNDHHRTPNFITKIEQILRDLKKDIGIYFSNSEIYKLFEDNKRIILFFIQEKIIIVDEYIASQIINHENKYHRYPEFFAPEIKSFITEEFIDKYGKERLKIKKDDLIKKIMIDIPIDFNEKRQEGESDDYLCKIIRLDKIEEFVAYATKTNLNFSSKIHISIFETNSKLMPQYKDVQIIEYAAFFGSLKILKYMYMNGAKFKESIWEYAIHSQNAEFIRFLEENKVSPLNNNFKFPLIHSIRCHHNDISNYIIENLIPEEKMKEDIENNYYNIYLYCVEFHNYYFFPENLDYKNMFFYLCIYNNCTLVKLYLQNKNIDINARNEI
ncbi:hypothetical protein M9Y10_003705 [Tritrichomonas musculus]|uniref:DUF3447 domain-containing protein n=1 Tax=Tritrichomonas musculus TaxID=1915356 RepID=A0ABR2JQE3_9EUKA